MTRALLTTAAAVALSVSGQAQAFDNHSASSVRVHSGFPNGNHHWRDHDRAFPRGVSGSVSGCDSRRDRHGRNGFNCASFGDFWGYYNPDFNRSWDSDSYNDWWHDRPDRAFPRWVQQRNETCEPDRMWWSGSGWHC